MGKVSFLHSRISGFSIVVPEKEISIYDEAQYYDNSIKKIDRMRKMVGFYKRRVADELTTPADLAYDAAQHLIEDMNIERSSIDMLIFVVQQPDTVNPSNAYFLHDKLGLSDNCLATDINQGCVGWIFGLYIASNMVESGLHKRVLLLNGDAPSIGIDQANRNTAPLFGDAAVATLIEYSESEIVSYYNIETKSSGYEALIKPFSGTRFRYDLAKEEDFKLMDNLRKVQLAMPNGQEVNLLGDYMDGMAVFDFTIKVVPQNVRELLEYANIKVNDLPVLCLHQANKQIIQSIGTEIGVPMEKVPYTAFENYGNNTMSSIPTTIKLLPSDTNMSQLCCCGFGNGLVCGSAILNLENTYMSEIYSFKRPNYIKTKEEYINYWKHKIKGEI